MIKRQFLQKKPRATQKDRWQRFIVLCTQLHTEKEFAELFNLFLTKAEQADIADRYDITMELLRGEATQRTLAKQLNISIAKITRGSNALKIIHPKIKQILQKNLVNSQKVRAK